ncbi:DUF1523 family protein [Paragemmobacter ruber]|uniref:DUF1523 family protein n=1 Tax=Paragemmobacter ruber TaxID=1985673 RepID=A0ABW9Y5B1_9RHOB|nr:DUF1523 family protein [Rhodobacter ruber]NBE07054.1 DUF1523 family protein [Rhodobacter ruber]
MRFLKWTVYGIAALLIFAFLHYTLPQTDIVRIVGTENRRMDLGENSWFWAAPDVGTGSGTSRDVFFINAVYPNGKTMEYRNEDTGWGWPPYFKMNSSSLNTSAKELQSTAAAPKWVAITHYGWRNQLFTIFPNAISLREVAGPDTRVIPWISIIILTVLAGILFMIRRMWLQFRERMIEPAVIEAQETLDDLDRRADRAKAGVGGWFRRVTGRK